MTSTSEYVSLSTGRAPLSVRGNDLYETPYVATEALLRAEKISLHVWEPACGPGAITRVLRAKGHCVIESDLVAYHPDHFAGRDFLMEMHAPAGVEAIVTNPPFKLADQFAAHALELVPQVYMLLRLSFMESERRRPILDRGQLARVHVFRNRLPMMHRHNYSRTSRNGSSALCFAWFCWSRDHHGPTVIDRIFWQPQEGTYDDDTQKREIGRVAAPGAAHGPA